MNNLVERNEAKTTTETLKHEGNSGSSGGGDGSSTSVKVLCRLHCTRVFCSCPSNCQSPSLCSSCKWKSVHTVSCAMVMANPSDGVGYCCEYIHQYTYVRDILCNTKINNCTLVHSQYDHALSLCLCVFFSLGRHSKQPIHFICDRNTSQLFYMSNVTNFILSLHFV